MVEQIGEKLYFVGKALIAALHSLLGFINTTFYHFDVCHNQLKVNDVDIPQGVGGAFHVGNIAVLKAAHNMHDGIGGADVGEELISKTFALGSTLNKTCDINEFDHSRGQLLGIVQIRQPLQTLIRNGYDTYIGVDGTKRIIICRDTCICNCVKEGRLANIGKSNDT